MAEAVTMRLEIESPDEDQSLNAMRFIMEALNPLDAEDQERVLKSVCIFLGVSV